MNQTELEPAAKEQDGEEGAERKPDELRVGVGGWAYLPIKKGNKLEVCSKIYDYVEVNSTFYSLPDVERVKKWRKTVPDDFEFTLRANRELTHAGRLEPTQKNFKVFERMLDISRELRAPIIHFQFPASLEVTDETVRGWRGFFSSVNSRRQSGGGPRFALEVRGNPDAKESPELRKLVSDYDIIPCSDASRSDATLRASPRSGILYSRVFGPGDHTKWTFDSKELEDIKEKVTETKARKRYVTFHNLTMYEDASRMKTLVRTGKDQSQPANAPLGVESLKRVIASGRAKFPATKQALIEEFGWRTFDKDRGTRAHVAPELGRLDEEGGPYGSAEEVIRALGH